jgi:hypothetical protein
MKPLTDSNNYKAFIQSRDQSLERYLARYLTAIDRIVDSLKNRCKEVASHIAIQEVSREKAKANRRMFDQRISPWFSMASKRASELLTQMRKTTYTLSYIGQAEAIGRAIGKRTRYELAARDIDEASKEEMTHGGRHEDRIEMHFDALKAKVIAAFQLSQVLESPVEEVLDRIERAFPKQTKMKRISKLIAPMREAAQDKKREGWSFGTIDEDEWEKIVDDYLSDEIPFGRSPEDKIMTGGVTPEGEDEFIYQWQLEQEVTDDFVSQVRDGEIDSANENGITDFQWIAIIDGKTDDCCLWRDGLTSAEIESQLENEHKGDDCDATTPPAHFNCRCRVAPMTDDMPKEEPADYGDFLDWLNTKAESA